MQVADDTGLVTLRFFHSGYMMSDARLSEGRSITLRGKAEVWRGQWQMVHPDWSMPEQFVPGFYARYGMLAGYNGKRIGAWIGHALTMLDAAACSPLDTVIAGYAGHDSNMGLHEALLAIHKPNASDMALSEQAMRRLKAEELLVYFALMGEQRKKAQVMAAQFEQWGLCERFLQQLPYNLTPAQAAAWQEIRQDVSTGKRMHRLLQGDVGSGKTWVAALSMLAAVGSGYQAAIMAPTEVLAGQHFEVLRPMFAACDIRAELLTGSTTKKQRKDMLVALASGALHVVIGTHALLSEDVRFQQLGLAVIDEQHRFGVRQRWGLTEKGQGVHLLAMSATPIPRSLALAVFGDLDLSVMRGMPPGRLPVETRVYRSQQLEKLYQGMQRMLEKDGRIYWIVPRISQEEEECGEMSVEARFKTLQARFPQELVMPLHGRMKSAEKQAALDAFSMGKSRILVSTTVVEVGVNVPEARLMVIEQAELYGLAQLHQLRGRVGRSDLQSYAMLLPGAQVGEQAYQRLQKMVHCHDGFELAEADLALRGAGDAIGQRQSGEAGFRLVDLSVDASLIEQIYHENLTFVACAGAEVIRFWRPDAESVD